jgi:hypothetical protein
MFNSACAQRQHGHHSFSLYPFLPTQHNTTQHNTDSFHPFHASSPLPALLRRVQMCHATLIGALFDFIEPSLIFLLLIMRQQFAFQASSRE